jgi:hypothetical protein
VRDDRRDARRRCGDRFDLPAKSLEQARRRRRRVRREELGELLDRLWPRGRILRERAMDRRGEILRHVGAQGGERRRLLVEELEEQLVVVLGLVRRAAADRFVEDRGDRVEVAARVGLPRAPRLFGRHVARRAEGHARRREGKWRVFRLRDPEIEELHVIAIAVVIDEEDVRWLQISMDDPLAVRRLEAARDPEGDVHRTFDGETRRAALEGGRQIDALEQLHHEVRAALELADVVDAHDVVGLELRGGDRFPLEALERALLLGAVVAHDLERDARLAPQMGRAIDAAHPAGAEARVDPVAAVEDVADLRLHQGAPARDFPVAAASS